MMSTPSAQPSNVLAPSPGRSATRLAFEAELTRLRAHARRLCDSESDALDLVQDTLVRALVYEHGFEPGSNLFAWLRRIQMSLFVSRYRSRRRERRALERVAIDPCSWVHSDGPPPAALVGRPVRRALHDLPESYRRVVELVDLGGLEYRDAARELGIPIGTVMSRLHRGRRQLAAQLREPGVSVRIGREVRAHVASPPTERVRAVPARGRLASGHDAKAHASECSAPPPRADIASARRAA